MLSDEIKIYSSKNSEISVNLGLHTAHLKHEYSFKQKFLDLRYIAVAIHGQQHCGFNRQFNTQKLNNSQLCFTKLNGNVLVAYATMLTCGWPH